MQYDDVRAASGGCEDRGQNQEMPSALDATVRRLVDEIVRPKPRVIVLLGLPGLQLAEAVTPYGRRIYAMSEALFQAVNRCAILQRGRDAALTNYAEVGYAYCSGSHVEYIEPDLRLPLPPKPIDGSGA